MAKLHTGTQARRQSVEGGGRRKGRGKNHIQESTGPRLSNHCDVPQRHHFFLAQKSQIPPSEKLTFLRGRTPVFSLSLSPSLLILSLFHLAAPAFETLQARRCGRARGSRLSSTVDGEQSVSGVRLHSGGR